MMQTYLGYAQPHLIRFVDEDNQVIKRRISVLADGDLNQRLFLDNDGFIDVPDGVKSLQVSSLEFEDVHISYTPYVKEYTLKAKVLQSDSSTLERAKQALYGLQQNQKSNQELWQNWSGSMVRKFGFYLDEYPTRIPYAMGVVVPPEADTGLVYLRINKSQISSTEGFFSERSKERLEAGKLRYNSVIATEQFILNFYKNHQYFQLVSKIGYRSPLAVPVGRHYHIEPKGKYKRYDHDIYVLSFSPRDPNGPYYKGEIHISEKSNQICGIKAEIAFKNRLELSDSVHIFQLYELDEKNFVPVSIMHKMFFSAGPNKGRLLITLDFENFKFESAESKDSTNLIAYDSKDAQALSNYRISTEEQFIIDEDKRYMQRREDGLVTDSLINHYSKRQIATALLTGIRIPTEQGKRTVQFSPLISGLGFNSIEGPYVRVKQFTEIHSKRKSYNFLDVRYGFVDRRVKIHNELGMDILPERNGKISLDFGIYYSQFNENEPITPLVNSVYSLFLGRNYMKLYQRMYSKANFSFEWFRGFDVNMTFEVARRSALFNNTEFTFTPEIWQNFTPNNPLVPGIIDPLEGFPKHMAAIYELNLSYQFARKYHRLGDRKTPANPENPKLYATYKKGLQIGNTLPDFDFATFGFYWSTRVANNGISRFDIQSGGFINQREVPFVDFKHFNGIQTIFLQRTADRWSDIKQFRTLRYYDYSTRDVFIEAHYEHNFGGTLLGKINGIQKLNLHLVTGINFLNIDFERSYFEWFVGFDNVLKFFKLEFTGGWDNFDTFRVATRVGFTLDLGLYYRSRRI